MAELISTGEFHLDPRRAREKLREFPALTDSCQSMVYWFDGALWINPTAPASSPS